MMIMMIERDVLAELWGRASSSQTNGSFPISPLARLDVPCYSLPRDIRAKQRLAPLARAASARLSREVVAGLRKMTAPSKNGGWRIGSPRGGSTAPFFLAPASDAPYREAGGAPGDDDGGGARIA